MKSLLLGCALLAGLTGCAGLRADAEAHELGQEQAATPGAVAAAHEQQAQIEAQALAGVQASAVASGSAAAAFPVAPFSVAPVTAAPVTAVPVTSVKDAAGIAAANDAAVAEAARLKAMADEVARKADEVAQKLDKAMAYEAQRQAQVQAQAESAKAKSAGEVALAQQIEAAARQELAERRAQAAVKPQADVKALVDTTSQPAAAGVAPARAPTVNEMLAPTVPVDPADYAGLVAEVNTTKGSMVLAFRADKAPQHVRNFVELARKGFYDGLAFHKIVPGFIIQGGDPKADGSGGPGYQLKAEFNELPHVRGTLSMSHAGHPDSAGSQFFICHAPQPSLDGKYTVFGMLVKGWDTLDAIAAVGSPGGSPQQVVTIEKIAIRAAQPDEQQP